MTRKDTDIERHGRQDRFIKERVHDPYMARAKLEEPTLCPKCGVVFKEGRWAWVEVAPGRAHEQMCPACQRIRDGVPAGFLTLQKSDFLASHRDEILNLVRNRVEHEASEHPLNRLMDIEEDEEGATVITFTDTHLPAGVGRAIESAYEGELDIHYTDEGGIVRAWWRR